MSDQRIHVAHILYSFATGGLENGVVNIINRLPENQYKHSIICISHYDQKFYERIKTNNTEIFELAKPPGRGFTWLWKCWKLLRKLKPDVCHTRNLGALEAQLAGFLSGVSYRIHGEHGWDVGDIGGKNVKYQNLRKLFRPLVHQYVALSIEARDYLLEKIAVPSDRINRICNGVDVEIFTPGSSNPFHEFTLNDGDVVFGTVGRLASVKNQTFLVNAFVELVKDKVPESNKLKLIIVGDGSLMPELVDIVEKNGLSSQVYLAGQRSDVADCLKAFNVFILPSLAEGISNTLLEAMATGLPFIATDVGGNGDLIYPPHADSHLIPVNNIDKLVSVMKQYANNPCLINEHSGLVHQHCVENFSIENMVGKYHQLYQSAKTKGI